MADEVANLFLDDFEWDKEALDGIGVGSSRGDSRKCIDIASTTLTAFSPSSDLGFAQSDSNLGDKSPPSAFAASSEFYGVETKPRLDTLGDCQPGSEPNDENVMATAHVDVDNAIGIEGPACKGMRVCSGCYIVGVVHYIGTPGQRACRSCRSKPSFVVPSARIRRLKFLASRKGVKTFKTEKSKVRGYVVEDECNHQMYVIFGSKEEAVACSMAHGNLEEVQEKLHIKYSCHVHRFEIHVIETSDNQLIDVSKKKQAAKFGDEWLGPISWKSPKNSAPTGRQYEDFPWQMHQKYPDSSVRKITENHIGNGKYVRMALLVPA